MEGDIHDLYILGKFDGIGIFSLQTRRGQWNINVTKDDIYHHVVPDSDRVDDAIKARGSNSLGYWTVEYKGEYYTLENEHIYLQPSGPGEALTIVKQTGQMVKVDSYTINPITIQEGETLQVGYTQDSEGKISDVSAQVVDPDSQRVSYETGAQRSAAVEHVRYDLIHPIFAKVLAEVLAEGAGKYGEHNWELGFPIQTLFNHMLAHIFDYLSGDRSEDHLGHAACNIMFLVVEARMREKNHASHLRLENCELSPEMIAAIKDFQAERARKNDSKKVEAIRSELNRLYIVGKLHHRPGCTVPVKTLGRNYFEDFAFSTLREALESMSYKINTDDCIVDLEMKESP